MTKTMIKQFHTFLFSRTALKAAVLIAFATILFAVLFQAASVKLIVSDGEHLAAFSIVELVLATGGDYGDDGEHGGYDDSDHKSKDDDKDDHDWKDKEDDNDKDKKDDKDHKDDDDDYKSGSSSGGSSSSGGGYKKPVCTLAGSPSTINLGDSATLSWTSENATSGSINQGVGALSPVTAGNTAVSPAATTLYAATFTSHKGTITCETTITVKTPPLVPVCPISSAPDRILITFDPAKRLYSNRGDSNAVSGPKNVSIPAGSYEVTLATFDNHSDKPGQAQPNEQWHLDLSDGAGTVALSASISDLPDNDDYIVEEVNGSLAIAKEVTKAFARHSAFPNKAPSNSLLPICAALDPIVVEQPKPMCTLALQNTTIQKGSTTTLSWTSANVTNGSIDQGVGATTPVAAGSTEVSPVVDTTYTAIFTGPYGDVECLASIVVVENPVPMCTLSIDPTAVDAGGSATLSWTSANVTDGVIDQNVGSTTPVAAGSTSVTPTANTTYTAAFTGPNGNVECTAAITINTSSSSSGGGSSSSSGGGSSGGGSPDPRVTLTKATPEPQLGFVTLSQLPYTGFPAGPVATSIFFTVLVVWSGVLAYFVTVKGYGRTFMNRLVASDNALRQAPMYGIPRDHGVMTSAVAVSPFENSAFVEAHGENDISSGVSSSGVDEEGGDQTSGTLRDELEEQAHEAGVLLSDEGLSYVAGVGTGASEMLGELIERAREEYPREDGWIHLNMERVRSLTGDGNPTTTAFENTYTAARSAATDIPANLPTDVRGNVVVAQKSEMSHPTSATIPTFIGWITAGDMNRAFSHLRVLYAQGRSTTDFLAEALCELDDAYQFQLAGEREVSAGTLQATKRLTKEDVERVIEYLLTGVDHSYSKEQVGVKMAMLRALSFTKRKYQK
jgi:uncharacterized membrane protein YgcG